MVNRYKLVILFGYSVFLLGLFTWILGFTFHGQEHISNPTSEFSLISTGVLAVVLHYLVRKKENKSKS